jgi:peptidylprolyl isomerase
MKKLIMSAFFLVATVSSVSEAAYIEKKILSAGNGEVLQPNDEIQIHYTLWANDKLIEKQNGFRFVLSEKKIIPGLYQALVGSRRGDKFTFSLPPELGYGSKAEGMIPANSVLKYELEILGSH